jgi:outer membrane receptor protein involved in Fe transport
MSVKSGRYYARLLGSASAITLLAAGIARAEPANFSIAPQPLTLAVGAFSEQSGRPVLLKPELADKLASPGVSGSLEPEIALAQMLNGTGLTFRKTGDTFLIVSASDPQSGSAAGDGAEGTVQALIVTAQKREENIQDVPIAMSAFTQEDLTRSQVAGGPDLMTQVPNFTFTKTNFTGYSIQIRGIGTQAISATTDAAVAVDFNNTPFIRNRFFEQEFYDLQRVEVLRGPQGTLYGRNATAGVVNLISQKPKFTYEAKASVDIGAYNSQRVEGMVNVPLVEDKVALRLAGAWTKRDGYDDNQITGNRIDGRNLWSTRLSLRFTPTDKLDVNLIWEHFQEDDDRIRSGKQLCKRSQPDTIAGLTVPWGHTGPGGNNGAIYDETFSQGCEAASLYSPDSFQAPNGLRLPYYRALGRFALPTVDVDPLTGKFFDPYASTTQSRDLRTIESTVDPIYKAETNTVELQASYDLTDHLTLTSETAWLSDTLFSSQDYNRFNTRPGAFRLDPVLIANGVLTSDGYFCDPQIGCANRLVAMDLSTADSSQFSEEFRIASNYDGPFNFSLGANFLRYDTEDKYYVFINTLTLAAADRAVGSVPPYVAGVSDNRECLPQGFVAPNVNAAQSIQNCIYIDPNPITSLNDLGHNYFLSKNPYKLLSYAVFGEAYYKITDNLKVTTGLRWTVDKKEAPRIPSWVLSANNVGYPVADVSEQQWREPTGRLALDWKPDLSFTDETLVYVSLAHGYKAGGANPPAAGLVLYATGLKTDFSLLALQQEAVAPKTFKPEFINAFEVGSKNTLLDGRLTLNGDVFYYDYTGYQISQIVNRSAINLNFDAKIWGAELETDWRPVENLRLGFKLGYERTRMAKGSQAVDTMDRTAGNPNWFVSAPFPTLPANCVLPTYLVTRPGGVLGMLGMAGGGNLGPCELAYVLDQDPLTEATYVANPPQPSSGTLYWYPGYAGFDPLAGSPGHPYTGQNTSNGVDYGPAPNGGAGFYKDLSGHELPNAPHITATITADYTIPLPNNWLATLHTDLYYQSEAWTRVFNTPGYDKLKAYSNINLAAIFSNEDAGWKIMAYVKNVLDRDSITGAFLNSDDTGLTTNVFLTEPRLYGLRVTKEFSGGPWWTGANPNHTGPYPLTVEIMGQVQRQDAPYTTMTAQAMADLPAGLDTSQGVQNRNLDWGDGRSVKLIYRPDGSPWSVSAAFRYGRTNTDTARPHVEQYDKGQICGIPDNFYSPPFPPGFFANFLCNPASPGYNSYISAYEHTSWSEAAARNREEHNVVDFAVGRDVGMGLGFSHSEVGAGLRYADFESTTDMTSQAVAGWQIPQGWAFYGIGNSRYQSDLHTRRKFKGAGPTLSWEAAKSLLGNADAGHLDVDWAITGGVLFGKQKVTFNGQEQIIYSHGPASVYGSYLAQVGPATVLPVPNGRTKSATVPVVDLSLGLSYEIQRIKVSTGYRWERYFNVLDAGYAERKSYDRTMDGPYFKIAVGFGG